MLTVVTYVLMSKTVMNDCVVNFCPRESFDSLLKNLALLEEMRQLSLKSDLLTAPQQKTFVYAKLFIKQPPSHDPFMESEEEQLQTSVNQKQEPPTPVKKTTKNDIVIEDEGLSISLDHQDSGSYDIEDYSDN